MSFLVLPREIRDQIYFLVIHFERDAPPSPHHEGISTRHRVKDKREVLSWVDPPKVHHEDGPFLLPYTCLAGTNRRIRPEVQEALITVQNSGKLVYKLDLMVNDRDIYVTWLSVPASAKHLAEPRVDFRRVSDSHRDRLGWGGRDESLGPMHLTMGRLLSRFIAHGPAFFGDAPCEAETLFDVLTLRLIGTVFMDYDYLGLNRCARLLKKYDILRCKTRLVRIHWKNQTVEHELTETPASRRSLDIWRGYGMYEVRTLP